MTNPTITPERVSEWLEADIKDYYPPSFTELARAYLTKSAQLEVAMAALDKARELFAIHYESECFTGYEAGEAMQDIDTTLEQIKAMAKETTTNKG